MRSRHLSVTLAAVALTGAGLAGCGGSSGPSGSTSGEHPVVLGGPAECPKRPYCEIGLKQTYGVKISGFKTLGDVGGPLTKKAIKDGTVDVGLVFTSDPTLAAEGLFVLQDDQNLQNSDNVVPVVQKSEATAPLTTALNAVNGKLSQDALLQMNAAIQLQHAPIETVASGFISGAGLDKAALCGGKTGSGNPTIGGFNFSESELLATIFSDALKACGYKPKLKTGIGDREAVYPLLKRGDLDIVPEYAASLTTFIKGTASGDIDTTMSALRGKLPSTLTALDPAAATDQNAFAVTKKFATAHNLTTMTDLGTYTQGS